MQRLEVSCAVRPIYGSLGAKGLNSRMDKKKRKKQSYRNTFMLHALMEITQLVVHGSTYITFSILYIATG
jgi:hypothetical protein